MSTPTTLAEAKSVAANLKSELDKVQTAKNDTTLMEAAKDVTAHSAVPLKVVRTLTGHLSKIYAMDWGGKDSKRLVSASQDGKLLIWNAWAKLKTHAIPLRSTWVMTCAFGKHPSTTLVASGGLDNVCSVYKIERDVSNSPTPRELGGHSGYISCCRFVNSQQILTSSGDLTCILWDIESNKCTTTFQGHRGDVMFVSLHGEDSFVSGGCDKTARVWDLRTDKASHIFTGHTDDINTVAFFPSGTAFVSGSDDHKCKLFDIRASRELMTYSNKDINSPLTSVGFSLSGRFLFAGYDDCTCFIWDTLKGTNIGALEHSERVSSLGINPSGEGLCTASWNSQLFIWAPEAAP